MTTIVIITDQTLTMNRQQSGENNNSIQEQDNSDVQESTTISFRASRSSSLESYERIQDQLLSIQRLRVIPTERSLDVTSNLAVQESNINSVDASANDSDIHAAADDSDPLGFRMNGNYRSIRLSTSDREPWHVRSSTIVVHVNPHSTMSLLESKYLASCCRHAVARAYHYYLLSFTFR